MGAFFLFNSDEPVDRDGVRAVFQRKGFTAPEEFSLGRMTLWLYRKQLVDEPNHLVADAGTAVFATGTVVYKGKPYAETLRTLLEDFRAGCLDQEELIGSFCLIFFADNRLSILTDRFNVHHVYLTEDGRRLSSSFLAVLASHRGPLPLNRLALYEKMSTGCVVGPDTLVSGVLQLTDGVRVRAGEDGYCFIPHAPRPGAVEFCTAGREACVEHQVSVLRRYFERIGPLAQRYAPELGLSSGYDSRLVLCLGKLLPVPLAAHTHWTLGVHEREKAIVELLSGVYGNPLRVVPSRRLEQHVEEDLAAILDDNVYYFDGRCGHDMGAYSETYTRKYRIEVLGDNRLSLSGLGGEIYRNYCFSSRKRVRFRDWMKHHVGFQVADRIISSRDVKEETWRHVLRKTSEILDADLSGTVDRFTTRRYFAEVRTPQSNGVNHGAHNQLTFYLTPFAEPSVVREAYRATPWIGLSGRFEAAMIARLDKRVADMPSHYGFPLTREPASHALYALLKGYVPDWLWLLRRRLVRNTTRRGVEELRGYREFVRRSRRMQEIDAAWRDYAPEIDLSWCVRDPFCKWNVVSVGSLLREFQSRIRVETA